MSDFAFKALFFVILSALFPLIGFYLDWRARRKNHYVEKPTAENTNAVHPKETNS